MCAQDSINTLAYGNNFWSIYIKIDTNYSQLLYFFFFTEYEGLCTEAMQYQEPGSLYRNKMQVWTIEGEKGENIGNAKIKKKLKKKIIYNYNSSNIKRRHVSQWYLSFQCKTKSKTPQCT